MDPLCGQRLYGQRAGCAKAYPSLRGIRFVIGERDGDRGRSGWDASDDALNRAETELRILYVDDDPDIRSLTVMALHLDPGIKVRAVGSGREALKIISAGTWLPNLFLLDVMMPEMSGPSLLTALRGIDRTAKIPAIFITARTNPVARREYSALRPLAIIAKPYDVLDLASEIRTILEKVPSRTG